MRRFIDLTGRKFSKLTVISKGKANNNGSITWLCSCDCGRDTITAGSLLIKGATRSCGCLKGEHSTIHGMSHTRLHDIWQGMIQRCTDKNAINFLAYGGRGITVCDKWLHSFVAFYNDMKSSYNPSLSIDRIDNNGNYEPSNCKWSTRKEQCNNTRRNHSLTFKGETLNICQWAEKLGMTYQSLSDRINKHHWAIERALTQPIRKR